MARKAGSDRPVDQEDRTMRRAATRGPLDPSPDDPEARLANRWRGLRDGLPSALYLLGWALLLLLVLVGLGMLLAKVLRHDAVGRADAGVDRLLAAHRNHDLDELTHWTTDLAETITITVVAGVTVALSALVWRRWREPLLVAVAVAGEVGIFVLVTLLVDRSRPPVRHLDPAPPTSSFPSGHTAAAVVTYGALWLLASEHVRSALWRGLAAALALLVPLLVGLSRLYRGMHYPSDVLAGALLGAVWLLATVKAVRLGVLHWTLRHGGGAGRLRRGGAVLRRG